MTSKLHRVSLHAATFFLLGHVLVAAAFGDLLVTGRNPLGGTYFRLREDNFNLLNQASPSQGNIGFLGIALDINRNPYVATDFGYHRAIKYTGATDVLATNPFTNTDTSSARDAIWSDDNTFFYIAGGAGVQRYNSSGVGGAFATITGGGGTVGLDFGLDGFLYVTSFTGKISKVDPITGTVTTFITDAQLGSTGDLAWHATNVLYVVASSKILRYSSTGAFIDVFANNILLNGANGLTFGNDGQMYAATPDNILKIDGVGNVTVAKARTLNLDMYNFQFLAFTPEPSTFWLGGLGGAALAFTAMRRRTRR